jgi:hypothetical protein
VWSAWGLKVFEAASSWSLMPVAIQLLYAPLGDEVRDGARRTIDGLVRKGGMAFAGVLILGLAAAVGLKCVAVVSARNPPEAWYPYGAGHIVLRTSPACEGCLLTECVEFGMKCLMDISTDQVLASVESLLPAPRS